MKTIQEIERRFLVKAIDPDIQRERCKRISQGYFDTPPHFSLRVRITDSAEAELTKKTGSGLERQETTHKVDLETAKFLFGSCADTLQKTRYFRDGWEVDFFHGPLAGLVIAEYEMSDRGQRLVLPRWIGDAVEVTESLTNRHLARLAHDLADARLDRPVRELLPKRIPHIVLTGGPCSGKSSVMSELQQEFGSLVHCVPEVATIVIAQVGVKPPVGDTVGMRRFQRTVYRVQRGFETISDLQAVRDGRSALLLDRGTVDGAAYMDGGVTELERSCRTSLDHEYGQYDLVICLETPPEQVYKDNQRNNPARHEDFDQAARLGKRIKKVWRDHPRFRYIRNCGSWRGKADAVKKTVREFLSAQ